MACPQKTSRPLQEEDEAEWSDDDFEYVREGTDDAEDPPVCVYDTAYGRKLHYEVRCSGLKTAKRIVRAYVCSCWSSTKEWPTPEMKVCCYRVGPKLFACPSGDCLWANAGSTFFRMLAAKEMCKFCRWKYAPATSEDARTDAADKLK